MGTSDTTYRVCEPDVVHETIDGETVVVNLGTGNYYSLRDAGAEVWRWIDRGATLPEIVDAVERRYEAADSAIEADVSALIARLLEEQLLEPFARNDVLDPSRNPSAAPPTREPYRPPILETHRDMQDLLLLDPIHDTDDSGWPNAAEDKPA